MSGEATRRYVGPMMEFTIAQWEWLEHYQLIVSGAFRTRRTRAKWENTSSHRLRVLTSRCPQGSEEVEEIIRSELPGPLWPGHDWPNLGQSFDEGQKQSSFINIYSAE